MDLSNEIKMLQERVKQLRQLRDVASHITETVVEIETEISGIDEAMPNPKSLSEIKDRKEREQLKKAEALLKDAYAIIDTILGPPEEEKGNPMSSEAFIPEAKGNSGGQMDFDTILKNYTPKKNLS